MVHDVDEALARFEGEGGAPQHDDEAFTRSTHMIGTILQYRLSVDDVRRIAEKRGTSATTGLGNYHEIGQVVPLIVVATHQDGEGNALVNGQALLDGADQLWITSAAKGNDPGFWFMNEDAAPTTAVATSDAGAAQ